ncbi:MAG: transglutaminase-like domain-containing protein [Promethearchaeota archaeon]
MDVSEEYLKEYLKPTFFINSDSKIVTDLVKKITLNTKTNIEKAISIFYWTRDEIRYDPYNSFSSKREMSKPSYKEKYKASYIITIKKGWCVQKACVLAALARASFIPSRLHFADIRNHAAPEKLKKMMGTDIFMYHGYTELFLNNTWVKATPAFNISLCQKFGLRAVEFDGIKDGILSGKTLNDQKYIEYIRDRGIFADFPFDKLFKELSEFYSFI